MEPDVEFLIIADSVEVVAGKLYMLGGGWNRWTAASYPSQVRLGLAVSVLVPWERTNERIPVRLSVSDSDGKPLGPEALTAEVEVGRPPGVTRGTNQRALLALNMGFPLQKPGRCEIRAGVGDSASERSVTFDAVLGGSG